MKGCQHNVFVVCLMAWCGTTVCVCAGEEAPSRVERLRFDPQQATWLDLPKPEPGTAAGDLALARASFSDGEYKKAGKAIARWHKEYGVTSEHYPEALLLRAQIEKARRNYYVAYQLLEEFHSEFRGTEAAGDAPVELFNIAEVFLSGVRRKLWGLRLLSAKDQALDILDRISTEYPNTNLGELSLKTKADYFFEGGDFALAELEYARLLQEYPAGQYRRYAMRRSADSALASFAGVHFDDAPLVEAEERYRMYADQYPGLAEQEGIGLILQDIREKRADKELRIAYYYRRARQPRAARFYFGSALTHWPDTIAARKAAGELSSAGPGKESVSLQGTSSDDARYQTGNVEAVEDDNGSRRP